MIALIMMVFNGDIDDNGDSNDNGKCDDLDNSDSDNELVMVIMI